MRICILGATGLVGGETLDLVARAWPGAELQLYASRERDFEHRGQKHIVKAAASLESNDAVGGDLAMVALDDDHSLRYVPKLRELGYRIVDKSNTYRMDPVVPLVAAGVNCGLVTDDVYLVANPNCTTIPFTMAVVPLARKYGLESVAVSSYQAISGAGVGPLREFLELSKAAYAEVNLLGTHLDTTGYVGNTVPHNGKTDASGFSSEERKLVAETQKILGDPNLLVCAQCCRVPVAVGHYMNAWITLGRAAEPAELEATIREQNAAPFVRVIDGPAGDGLTALAGVADRDNALAGRIRKDPRDPSGRTFCITVTGDNLRLGAATNAVRIASRWFPSADPLLQSPGASPQ